MHAHTLRKRNREWGDKQGEKQKKYELLLSADSVHKWPQQLNLVKLP